MGLCGSEGGSNCGLGSDGGLCLEGYWGELWVWWLEGKEREVESGIGVVGVWVEEIVCVGGEGDRVGV